MNDEIFPIEDSLLPLQHGDVKEARYISSYNFVTVGLLVCCGFGNTDKSLDSSRMANTWVSLGSQNQSSIGLISFLPKNK